MKTIIITNTAPRNIKEIITIKSNDYIIAVDGSIAEVIKQGIKIDLAIGDFDSLTDKHLLNDLKTITLMKNKDETDTYVAVEYGYEYTNNKVIVIGGIQGSRIEHFIANMYLFNAFPNLIIKDENSTIYMLEEGTHEVSYKGYISLFGYNEAKLSITGFNYNLEDYNLKAFDPLCISNELNEKSGTIDILSGRIIVIESTKK